ncbi:hypothetical protein E8E12_003840 [Didymella heteroderae]|uniref:BZIP domain-containing protein n=1 Tax=Didymella heteroderae TaxID=1769908 RepID=A0A9P5BXY9_9PLEO|nr:hypothetical protein E8E12_003840 [Didymella heteroderae]
MELNSWDHSEWTEHHSSTPSNPFSNDRNNIFGTGAEQTLGLPLHLLNHASLEAIERPDRTGTVSNGHHNCVRAGSVPVEQLKGEILWPQQQVDISEQEQHQPMLMRQDTWQSTSTDTLPSTEVQYGIATEGSGNTRPAVAPIIGKRKRGRPRLYATPPYEHSSDLFVDITTDSRKSQLEKNRIAAEKSRRRRKEHTNGLMSNVSVLSSRNEALKAEESALREELLNLKNEILRHAGCSSSIIDGYIARIAGSKLVEVAPEYTLSRKDSGHTSSPERRDKSPSLAAWKGSQAQPGLIGPNAHDKTNGHDLFELMNNFLDAEG